MAVCLNDDLVVQLKTYEKYYTDGLLKDKVVYFRIISFPDRYEVTATIDGYDDYSIKLADFVKYPTRENNYQGFSLDEIVGEYINVDDGDCYFEVAEFYHRMKDNY